MELNYEPLTRLRQIDVHIFIMMLMYDFHPCTMVRPFTEWQTALEAVLNGKKPTSFTKLTQTWDNLPLSKEDEQWAEHHWPSRKDGNQETLAETTPNSDAWKQLSFDDLSMLYHFATEDVHPCKRGDRIITLCRILIESCGGVAKDYKETYFAWEAEYTVK